MKTVGITGPPGAGKTTLWRAITGASFGEAGVVEVPDTRVDALADIHGSRNRVHVRLEFDDVHAHGRTPAAALARLREVDAVLAVLPSFGGLDPVAAGRSLLDDLIIADMGPIETRLERARKDKTAGQEVPVLESALACLQDSKPLRSVAWDEMEQKVLSSLAPVTLRPLIEVLNVDEDSLGSPASGGLALCAALEAEVAGLAGDEAATLLQLYGIAEPASSRVVAEVWRALDLITFFSSEPKETRAWAVTDGSHAPAAAGVIHTDFQRGFIRAEVASFEEVVAAGSWEGAKSSGKVRVEGKDYIVREGDVVRFRFNV